MTRKNQTRKSANPAACPCGGGDFAQCCGRFLGPGPGDQAAAETVPQDVHPATAEALMRSRYSAYVRRDEAYLRATWHPDTCPTESILDAEPCQWLGLDIRHHTRQGETAEVEFVARYKIGGRAHRLHEVSRFVRQDGRWFYRDGSFP